MSTSRLSDLHLCSHPSQELNAIPNQRLRKGLKSRICDTLHQRMENCQKGIKHVSALGQATLSEGSIPRVEETRHLVTTARAQQFRRLIHLVLSRDRRGLEEMGRTVNIPALLGVQMVNFDPDNLQAGLVMAFLGFICNFLK